MERRERQRGLRLQTLGAEHSHVAHRGQNLRQQRRLPHTGFPMHHDAAGRPVAGVLNECDETRQLDVSPVQHAVTVPRAHRLDNRRRHRWLLTGREAAWRGSRLSDDVLPCRHNATERQRSVSQSERNRYVPQMVHIEKGAHRSGRSTGIAALLLSGMAGFQIALAAGAPWGAAAWGGTNPGVLPRGLRVSSAGSGLVYVLLAVAARSTLLPAQLRRRILTVASGGMVVGTVMNLASPSKIERTLWTPVAAALAAVLWLARSDRAAR